MKPYLVLEPTGRVHLESVIHPPRPPSGRSLRDALPAESLRLVLQHSLLEPRTALIGRTLDGLPWRFSLGAGRPDHLSISGPRGCGKSELLRSCLVSLCWSTSPQALGVVGIDPSGCQLGMIDRLPHARLEPVVDRRRARALLDWLADEVRHRQLGLDRAPSMVVAVEDLAAWGGTAELESRLAWLCQFGGSVGVHVLQITPAKSAVEPAPTAGMQLARGREVPGRFRILGRDGVQAIQAMWLPVRDLVACLEDIRQQAWLAGVSGSPEACRPQ